jgi:hypothetical protein
MSEPKRIQRKRTKGFCLADHCDNPNGYVYVGRGSKWGNPFRVNEVNLAYRYIVCNYDQDPVTILAEFDSKEEAAEFAVSEYRKLIKSELGIWWGWLEPLRGKDLACWCPLSQPCHADILLELANS